MKVPHRFVRPHPPLLRLYLTQGSCLRPLCSRSQKAGGANDPTSALGKSWASALSTALTFHYVQLDSRWATSSGRRNGLRHDLVLMFPKGWLASQSDLWPCNVSSPKSVLKKHSIQIHFFFLNYRNPIMFSISVSWRFGIWPQSQLSWGKCNLQAQGWTCLKRS